jgi:ABC-2 type transport system permease protein
MQISAKDLPAISANIYLHFMAFQATLAFLLTAFVAPGLIAADLANNGLPLYLSRPFSRGEYVLGKMWVLLGLQSLITWVPGLLLILLQGSLEGGDWFWQHWRYPFAVFFGFWIWILLVSLVGLALSAWVKWRLAAAALLLGVFFVTAGFGAAINGILETKWGDLLILVEQFRTVWLWLFGLPIPDTRTPITSAWAVLIGVCVLCLALLGRKLRAYEVVK